MPEGVGLALSLAILAATLGAAVSRGRYPYEAAAAALGALLLVAFGAIGLSRAGDALDSLAPTVGFLAALLLIAEGCRREGLFDAIGALMARRSGGSPPRLLASVVVVATVVTALLGLDATAVLLTPIVFVTATRMRTDPRPHVFASGHLSNSASLLLPISNLTNLLAFHASGLSFARFVGLMAAPTVGVVLVEWALLRRFFAAELERPREPAAAPAQRAQLPRVAVCLLGLTLLGFALSSPVGVAPVWVAVAGAVAFGARGLATRRSAPADLARALEPGFLVFVLGLGVIVATAGHDGVATAVRALLPTGSSLPDLLAVAAVSARAGEPCQQPPGDADPDPRCACGWWACRAAGDADRGQRRPQPDLRRLARDAAVAAGPARTGRRRRPARIRASRGAHGARVSLCGERASMVHPSGLRDARARLDR